MEKERRDMPVTIKGGPDRDAQNVPYGFGNRKERRRIAKDVAKIAVGIRAKRKNKEPEGGKD